MYWCVLYNIIIIIIFKHTSALIREPTFGRGMTSSLVGSLAESRRVTHPWESDPAVKKQVTHTVPSAGSSISTLSAVELGGAA